MSAIDVGDLVVVTRPTPCCNRTDSIGRVFRVASIADRVSGYCHGCGLEQVRTVATPTADDAAGFVVERLTKLDSPAQDNDVNSEEALHA